MRNSIVYLEFPVGFKDSMLRYIVTLVVLVIISYATNYKMYLISNSLLAILLTLIDTDRADYTILYSSIIGLGVFGYYNFRTYSPKYSEPYKYTGYGILISVMAGMASHFVAEHWKAI